MAFGITRLLSLLLASSAAYGQLSGSVGPTTSRSAKQATICNVLDYGGSIGSSVCISFILGKCGPNDVYFWCRILGPLFKAPLQTVCSHTLVLRSMFLLAATTCKPGLTSAAELNGPSNWMGSFIAQVELFTSRSFIICISYWILQVLRVVTWSRLQMPTTSSSFPVTVLVPSKDMVINAETQGKWTYNRSMRYLL